MEELDIIEIFWDALEPGETEDDSLFTEERWNLIYDHGLVDHRKTPKTRWDQFLKTFPAQEGTHYLKRTDLPKISPFLYHGPIKKPFDPERLKDGVRPRKWLQEMYQKVLKYETVLKVQEWNQILVKEVDSRFKSGDHYRFDRAFKDWVNKLLTEKASPLRKLEVWVYIACPLDEDSEAEIIPQPNEPTVAPIEDKFVGTPEKGKKIRSIEKVYFEESKPPPGDDQDALDFLKELEEMEDDPKTPIT